MRTVRIGNDITVRCIVTRDLEEENFSGKILELYLISSYDSKQITDYTISGNVISFVFKGVQQKYCGDYIVTLLESFEGKQNVVDSFIAFKLVDKSYKEGGEDDIEVEVDPINLQLNISTGYVINDNIFVALLKKYIDDATIYWDDVNKVIKARGGGAIETYDIEISSIAADFDKWEIEVAGNYSEIVEEGDKRIIKAISDGSVTISFLPQAGYAVSSVSLDDIIQTDLSKITIERISSIHYIDIGLESVAIVPPTYKRSDTNALYVGIAQTLSAIMADYPTGLDKDIEILCITEGIDQRGNDYEPKSSLNNLSVKNWNYDTEYCLTINGNDKLTVDGAGAGGLSFDGVGGLIIKGIKFVNCWTYEGVSTTESDACIKIKNTNSYNLKNIYIGNITIQGQSTASPSSSNYRTRYGISISGVENVQLYNININQVTIFPVNIDSVVCYLSKITFNKSDMRLGVAGHPVILNITSKIAYVCDCDINGSSYKYDAGIAINNAKYIYLYRNKIHDFDGPVFTIVNSYGMKEVDFDSNYMYANVLNPSYSYARSWIYALSDVDLLKFNNNTIVHTSTYNQVFFMRTETNVGRFIHFNNIYQRVVGNDVQLLNWTFGKLGELKAGNNVYNMNSSIRYYYTGVDSTVNLKGVATNLDGIKALGYEANSVYLTALNTLLMADRPCLSESNKDLYKPDLEYISPFDINYKANGNDATLGCDNFNSAEFDETIDTTKSYTGVNVDTETIFDNTGGTYSVPAEERVVILINSLNRSLINKFSLVDSNETLLYIGKLALVKPYPNVDENGEYISDKSYNLEVQ